MQTFLNVGVDVAKDAVVVACAAQSFPAHSVANQRVPLLAWLKSLPAGSRIGLESTGGYHELLADLAHAQSHTVFLLNPLDTKHYARAMGIPPRAILPTRVEVAHGNCCDMGIVAKTTHFLLTVRVAFLQ